MQDLYDFPEGKDEKGTLRHLLERFRWKEEEITIEPKIRIRRNGIRNREVSVQVYT